MPNGSNSTAQFKRAALFHELREAFTIVNGHVQHLKRRQQSGFTLLDGDLQPIEAGLARLGAGIERLKQLDA